MIGIDTNLLVRYITQDDVTQSKLATDLIENECSAATPGFISLIALVELASVSATCYGADRHEMAEIVRHILSIWQLVVQETEIVWKALRGFESSKADFADSLVAHLAAAAGCASVMTFDKAAAKGGMTLLK